MSKIKDLTKFSVEQLQEFLASFNIVMSDIDGVVWNIDTPIEGSLEALAALQKLGKQVYLVTNNSVFPKEPYHEKALQIGLDINLDNIINTSNVIVWYLKKIDFHGDVFAIASDAFNKTLREAGIQLVEEESYQSGNSDSKKFTQWYSKLFRNSVAIYTEVVLKTTILLKQLLHNWWHQSGTFWIPPRIYVEKARGEIIYSSCQPKLFLNNPRETLKQVLDRPSVKAVIVDFDIKCNWQKLALAVSCLERKDVLYISGAMDSWIGSQGLKVLGAKGLTNLISEQSGRKPILCAKPSQFLKDYILETCNVNDPKKCLFIGDTIDQDMKFASMCGFTKLFVGTGCNTLEEIQKEDDTCPDYYLPALNQLFFNYKKITTSDAASNKDT